ncbi:hypothetical protein ANN_19128 [Periplaneta americana]|uniref:Uncharacterized protein n=1 Tax=Periplaneta americana TaxID=6978 RepID=A0ABQ8S976_PERAM|nr:hypothetical protein ANN_19128 [Periplaneta americana]
MFILGFHKIPRKGKIKSLTVHEILDIVEDKESMVNNIAIGPPFEEKEAETDQDSDLSYNEAQDNVDHLPARILRSRALLEFDDGYHSDTSAIPAITGTFGIYTIPTKTNAATSAMVSSSMVPMKSNVSSATQCSFAGNVPIQPRKIMNLTTSNLKCSKGSRVKTSK